MREIKLSDYLVCFSAERAEEKETHEENVFVRKTAVDFFSSPRNTILISTLNPFFWRLNSWLKLCGEVFDNFMEDLNCSYRDQWKGFFVNPFFKASGFKMLPYNLRYYK